MNNRGLISVLALWLSASAAAIGLAALIMAKRNNRDAAREMVQTRMRYAAVTAAIVTRADNFSRPRLERVIDHCAVIATAHPASDGKTLTLVCITRFGTAEQEFDIGWRRTGSNWVPSWWRER